jgi:hypothetical protein
MVDPDLRLVAALARLRVAEQRMADAETELIAAIREVATARLGSSYKRAIDASWSMEPGEMSAGLARRARDPWS